MCSVNYQCSSITKQKCQCKNRVTIEGEFCKHHSKKDVGVIQIINSFNTSININSQPENTQEYTIPENIFVNGKFIPNVNKIQVPLLKKPQRGGPFTPQNISGVNTCGKTPEEMYKYLFPK